MGNSLVFFLLIAPPYMKKVRASLFLEEVSLNVHRMKFLPYFAFAVSVSSIILLAQYAVHKKYRTFEEMIDKKLSAFYMIICGIGYINTASWLKGMEGNVFGFIFVPIILILSVIIFSYEIAFFFRLRLENKSFLNDAMYHLAIVCFLIFTWLFFKKVSAFF